MTPKNAYQTLDLGQHTSKENYYRSTFWHDTSLHPSLERAGFVRIEVTTQQKMEETKAEALRPFILNASLTFKFLLY